MTAASSVRLFGGLASCLVWFGCRDGVEPGPTFVEVASLRAAPSNQLDILFVIDDTQLENQTNLANNIATLFSAITIDGAIPELHVGAITSDMGTRNSLDPLQPAPPVGNVGMGGCAGTGKDGALQTFGASISGGERFISDLAATDGTRLTNYNGTLEEVTSQILKAGAGGCGFEQPLAALRRALVNPTNTGFFRPDAGLAVIVLSDEDDCSIRDPAMFDESAVALGELQSFRCTQFGVECDEDIAVPGAKSNCRPADQSVYLDAIALAADDLERDRPDGSVVVAGIFGDPEPVVVELRGPPGGGPPINALGHSCSVTDVTGTANLLVGDPGVRLASFVDQFGARGVWTSVCLPSYALALTEIARATKQLLGVGCVDTSGLADDSADPGVQPRCTARDAAGDIPRCPGDGTCFDLVVDPAACPGAGQLRVTFQRSTPAASVTSVACERAAAATE